MPRPFEDRIDEILDRIIAEGPMPTIKPTIKPQIGPSQEAFPSPEDEEIPQSADKDQAKKELLKREKEKAELQAEKEAIIKDVQEKSGVDTSIEKRIENLNKDTAQEVNDLEGQKMSLVQQIMQKVLDLNSVDFTKNYENQKIISEQKLDRAIDYIIDDML